MNTKIKSVWCEVEIEEGKTLHTMVPLDVFIYLKDVAFVEKDMAMYTKEQMDEIKKWKPNE